MGTLRHDARFGLRMLRKRPAFSLTAILTLALGIGVCGAVFNLAMTGLFPRLPVREPDRLVAIFLFGDFGGGPGYYSSLSYPTYRDYTARLASFSGIAAFQSESLNLSHREGAERIQAELVSPNYFSVLGVDMALGRTFATEIEAGVADELAILSHAFWRRALAADTAVIGEAIWLNGRRLRVIGVAAAGYGGLTLGEEADVWLPFTTRDRVLTYWRPEYDASRTSHQLSVVGRLQPGVSIDRAAQEVEAMAAALAETYPEEQAGWTARVMPAAEATIWPGRRGELVELARTLAVIVGLILALASANVANMLIGRVAARSGEISVRLALGAGQKRVAQQLLLESLMLVAPAALLALIVAAWVGGFLVRFRVSGLLPAGMDVPVDARTLVFVLVAALLIACLTALAPAAHVLGWKSGAVLRGGRTEGGGLGAGAFGALRRGLSVVQIAGSLAVLACGGLLVRSAVHLLRVDLGFEPEGVALVTVDPAASGFDRTAAFQLYARALEGIESMPGVESVAATVTVPMGRMRFATGVIVDPGDETPRSITGNVVTPGYLVTMGITLLRGRDFREREPAGSLIVSEAAARSFWPGADPLGRRLLLGEEEFSVIGVARDARLGRRPFAEVEPFLYLPMAVYEEGSGGTAPALTFHVRTSGIDAADVIPQVRAVVAELAPQLPAFGARTLESQVGSVLAPALTTATYVSILGLLALLLAAIGIYAVIHNSVVQRTREIGIRLALGAEPGRVVRFVVSGGARLTVVGVAMGLAGGLLAARLLRGSLHGIGAADPLAFASAAVVTVAVSLGAAYLPARRAAQIDPQEALRAE